MIDMLKGGLVPFIRVVEVLCDGNPYQDCYGCGKRVNLVNLEDVIIYKRIDLLGLSTPLCKDISAILHFGDIGGEKNLAFWKKSKALWYARFNNIMERYDINIDVRVLPHDIAIINPFDTKK